jgi:hypothetical protein
MTDHNDTVADSPAERYAFGKMAESEELAFEIRMLEDPRLAAEVEAIQRMREGFKAADPRVGLALSRRRWFAGWRYGLAAMLALVAVGGAVLMMNARPRSSAAPPALASSLAELGIKASGARKVTATILLAHTRGQEAPTELALARNSDVVALRILPGVAGDSSAYRVTLERLTDMAPQAIAADVAAMSDESGFVTLYADCSWLTPGVYRLSLTQTARIEAFLLHVSAAQ